MEGGIQAWMGMTAEGPPEAAAAYFAAGSGAADMASLAWALEEATRQFYRKLADRYPGNIAAQLFSSLVQAEEHHKATLASLHESLSSEPVGRMYDQQEQKIMEGGIEMEAALKWSEEKNIIDILEFTLGLESNAYDRYLGMLDAVEDEPSKQVFRSIAGEEKGHLKRLADLLDEKLKTRTK
jgi:rubrerythrin